MRFLPPYFLPSYARTLAIALFLAAGLPRANAVERIYYIEADAIVWDYAPSYPENPITGKPFTGAEEVFVMQKDERIGRKYYKAVYREYTDATFTTLKARGPDEQSLGILGPIIRAEVGDSITVVFRNNTTIPVGIHPHGVFYEKSSEGAHYATDDKAPAHEHGPAAQADASSQGVPETGAHVQPQGRYTYHWRVPERAGPGPSDPDSIVWLYHSHDHESQSINAGLVGAIIVTRAGRAKADGRPKDVDREFVLLFMIFDETMSPYIYRNVMEFSVSEGPVRRRNVEFRESNSKHAINGLLYGNLQGLSMRRGERVRWYVIGLGNENDLHTVHWHGNTVLRHGSRLDTVDVFPATTQVVDMRPDDAGTWLLHCHVADHMAGGMMARYTVRAE
ncbi:MAG TPA: multicopper oxidase domain-containing protein [Burkholderiales bacterium]|nr:multicopper oxidase domain-containing protein [Burkholderiales bacterium]